MNLDINRRRFLATTASALAGTALLHARSADPSLKNQQATSQGTRRLIDTHTHFYDPTRPQGVPWPPRDDRLLYRRVLPTDYLALPVPTRVTGTVVVEASPWVEDNQWVLELARKHTFIVGLVGSLPVGTKEFAGLLDRFAANPLFRGLRLRDRKLDGALEDADFVTDLKRMAAHDLSLDVVGGLEIVAFARQLAGQLPDLRLVIDHLAGVRIDGKALPAAWLEQMRALAAHRNVYCKLSGLVEGTGRADGSAPRDVEFYRPVLEAMWERFGPERLLYASNWPVSERFAPLATVQAIVSQYARSKGRAAEDHVFWRTAQAAYHYVERKERG